MAGKLGRWVSGGAQAVDLLQPQPERGRGLASLLRRSQAVAADRRLERVGELTALEHPRRAQVVQELVSADVDQRAPRQREQAPAEWRVLEGRGPCARDGNAVGGEHALEQRARGCHRAQNDSDLVEWHSRSQLLEHVRRDELSLRPLAAGLEQPHGGAWIDSGAGALEQPALEVVQR